MKARYSTAVWPKDRRNQKVMAAKIAELEETQTLAKQTAYKLLKQVLPPVKHPPVVGVGKSSENDSQQESYQALPPVTGHTIEGS